MLDRRDAATDAEVVAAAGQLVGGAEVLDHADRVMEREQLDHQPEPDAVVICDAAATIMSWFGAMQRSQP